ncbi:MAG: glutathione synthase, partial [Deltaproteobacteria bacterium]|nr:glutathione synthase [Deltaproteobacteria bacterium]
MNNKKLKMGFVIDPLSNFDPDRETTLLMMREAQARGHSLFVFTLDHLCYRHPVLQAHATEIKTLKKGISPFYRAVQHSIEDLSSFDVIFLRKDPPFDLPYLHHLYLLQSLKGKVFMMNEPEGILKVAEKIYPLQFPDFIPSTCITQNLEEARSFFHQQRRGVVLKPIDSSGGRGIFSLKKGDSNFKVAFEQLSQNQTQFVICQEYLPQVRIGDKRVVLLDGKILGYFLRVPKKGEHRANLHSGGLLKACSLSVKEKKLAEKVGETLKKEGLTFVGLDLIGEKLTEINVTSPMGLNEINQTQSLH